MQLQIEDNHLWRGINIIRASSLLVEFHPQVRQAEKGFQDNKMGRCYIREFR